MGLLWVRQRPIAVMFRFDGQFPVTTVTESLKLFRRYSFGIVQRHRKEISQFMDKNGICHNIAGMVHRCWRRCRLGFIVILVTLNGSGCKPSRDDRMILTIATNISIAVKGRDENSLMKLLTAEHAADAKAINQDVLSWFDSFSSGPPVYNNYKIYYRRGAAVLYRGNTNSPEQWGEAGIVFVNVNGAWHPTTQRVFPSD